MAPVILSDKGFTLIEFLVSIVILMVGLLGLLQTINLAFNHNLQNQIRNDAVGVADAEMAKELAKGYNGVDPSNSAVFCGYVVTRQIMNTFKSYSVVKSGSVLQHSKQVTIVASWKHRGQSYSHNATAVISNTNQ